MITDQNVQELLHYRPEHPVLSVYLNTDSAEGNADFHRRRLRSMLKDAGLAKDVEEVIEFFDHGHDWSGRSVAVFSCAQEDFFRAYSMAILIRSRVRVGNRPYVKPLADLLDSYGGYGVVLVDKQGARFFYFHLGDLQEKEGLFGESVRHTKRGGGSTAAGRRGGIAGQTDYVEEVTERNMREAADAAVKFFAEKNVRRIVIGGTEDNVAMFRTLLPKSWQSLVVGSFPISMVATKNEVLQKAMEIGEAAEHRREAQLVNAVITNAAKGRAGVVGLQGTLDAIREGRVQTLVLLEGYRQPGNRCTSCGYISSQPMETCPYCGGKAEQIPDAVELAVRQVMRSGADVEVLHPEQISNGFDRIGAILRY
jgi:peptide subunit release factor 1 (eRF1)